MKVIKPIAVIDALLISSTVAEPAAGETAWVSGTTYALGDLRIRTSTHRVYKRLVAGAGTTPPESDSVNWQDVAPTNRWAMFDQLINTQTSGTSPLTVTLAPGLVNSLALIELVGTQAAITVTDGAAGPTVYSRTISLEASVVADWYTYFFEPFSQRGTLVLTDLPPYASARVTVSITGAGTVKCGGFIVGSAYDLGDSLYGASAGIRDYSRKQVDATTGAVTLEQRKFARIMRARMQTSPGAAGVIQTLLSGLRATPCVWVGDDGAGIEPLTVFGFYKDFSLDVAFANAHFYSLEIEGMT